MSDEEIQQIYMVVMEITKNYPHWDKDKAE
jgi:hypothetical protein